MQEYYLVVSLLFNTVYEENKRDIIKMAKLLFLELWLFHSEYYQENQSDLFYVLKKRRKTPFFDQLILS